MRNAGPAVLVFCYTVTDADTDDDGVAVPADGIRLAGGTIADAQGGAAALGHDAVAADLAYRVDGSLTALTGGVCERTPQVRDALVAEAQANRPAAMDCSLVTTDDLAGIDAALRLDSLGIAALKPGDFEGLSGVTLLSLTNNALSALPAGVFDGLGAVAILRLTFNALGAGSIEDGVFEPLTGLSTLALSRNPGSAELRAEGGCRGGPGPARGRECDAGRAGHGPGPVGDECRIRLGRGRRGGQPGGGYGAHGGPRGDGRGAAGLHRAGARRGAGAALPVHGPGPGAWPTAMPTPRAIR